MSVENYKPKLQLSCNGVLYLLWAGLSLSGDSVISRAFHDKLSSRSGVLCYYLIKENRERVSLSTLVSNDESE